MAWYDGIGAFFGLGEDKFDFNTARGENGWSLNDYNDLYGADGLSEMASFLGRNAETGELLDQSGFLTNKDGSFDWDGFQKTLGTFASLGGLYLGNENRRMAATALDRDWASKVLNSQNQVAQLDDYYTQRNERQALAQGLSADQAKPIPEFRTLG